MRPVYGNWPNGNGWPGRVTELRASAGLELLRPAPEPDPDVPAEDRQGMARVDVGCVKRGLWPEIGAALPLSHPDLVKMG
jgi:hypothetical protein